MNGSCAGGTGAFIDQMATLLDVTPSRAGRARSSSASASTPSPPAAAYSPRRDIQPLLNQGARKEDVAASHLSGRGQPDHRGSGAGPRRSKGKVLFLGGPLYFCQGSAAALSRDAEA